MECDNLTVTKVTKGGEAVLPEERHITSTISSPSPIRSTVLCPLPNISFQEVGDKECIV